MPAIISATSLAIIAIGSRDDTWTLQMAARALQQLSAAGVDVLMFSHTFSEHGPNLVRERDQVRCLNALGRECSDCCSLGATDKVATVSVVGVPGWKKTSVVLHAFAALGKHGTRVIAVAQAATEFSVSSCIPQHQVANTVRFVHRKFGLEG